jgi:hypothetical protein
MLFRVLHESFQIGVVLLSLEEEMDVIGHDAVHKNCDPFVRADALKLIEYEVHNHGIGEDSHPIQGANRQEIPLNADVLEAGNPTWTRYAVLVSEQVEGHVGGAVRRV